MSRSRRPLDHTGELEGRDKETLTQWASQSESRVPWDKKERKKGLVLTKHRTNKAKH